MSVFLLLLQACDGCQPQLPRPPQEQEDRDDSGDSGADSGDTADTDVGPPPLCDVEEIEPNDVTAQALPMETWACGKYDVAFDIERLAFSSNQPGWIEVDVESAARGTSADSQLQLGWDDESAVVADAYLTTDPRIVFPAESAGEFEIILGETHYGYGDDYGWWAMATLVKPPVEWDAEEAEGNDALATAEVFPVGQRVLGGIGEVGDFDWYVVTLPEEEATVTFDVQAYVHGSPANLKIELYDADGAFLREDFTGEIDYDLDPWFEKRVTGATTWYVLVRTEDDRGGPFHWYTLSITSAPRG